MQIYCSANSKSNHTGAKLWVDSSKQNFWLQTVATFLATGSMFQKSNCCWKFIILITVQNKLCGLFYLIKEIEFAAFLHHMDLQ